MPIKNSLLAIFLFSISVASFSQEPFITTWKTDNPGISENNQITIPTTGSGYNYSVTWEELDNPTNSGSEGPFTGSATITFPNTGIYQVSITGDFPRIYFADVFIIGELETEKILSVEQWGDIQWSSMERAFAGCSQLRIHATDTPDLTNVTDMSYVFFEATALNDNIGSWNVSNVTNLSHAFERAENFNQDISSWNVGNVTDMTLIFSGAKRFNQVITNWDVKNVENMSGMFSGAEDFDQPLNNWNVSSVTNMNSLFSGAASFDQPLVDWNVSAVTTMISMFEGATSFNQPIGNWNTGFVTNMRWMFKDAIVFNQPLAEWNTSSVTNMIGMFNNADLFDQSLENWNTEKVESIREMFYGANKFNRPLGNWNVSAVIDMRDMFRSASSFNQPLGNWNTGLVTDMRGMFDNASSFDQSLANWDVSNVIDMTRIFKNARLSVENYDYLLTSWSQQNLQTGLTLEAPLMFYCSSAHERQSILDDFGWTIVDEGRSCTIETVGGRSGGISFIFDNQAYMGLGENNSNVYADFFKIDLSTNKLSEIAEFPAVGRYEAVSFVIDDKAYVGSGMDQDGNVLDDFYEYDPVLNEWTQITSLTGDARRSAVAFTLEGEGYLGTGRSATTELDDFWKYNPATDEWAEVTGFTGDARQEAVAFVIDEKAYVSGGVSFTSGTFQYNDIQEFDPSNGWTEKVFADLDLGFQSATAFILNDIAFIAYGNQGYITSYDPNTNEIVNLGDTLNLDNEGIGNVRADAIGFVLGNTAYFGFGSSGFSPVTYYNDLIKLETPKSFFITTWKTSASNESITIPTNSGYDYNYSVDWGDGNVENDLSGDATHEYAEAGTYEVSISGNFPAIFFNNSFPSEGDNSTKISEVNQWGDIRWETMDHAFAGCTNLKMEAQDVPDLSNVTDLGSMFFNADSLNQDISNWDVSNVVFMDRVFTLTELFNQNISDWDMSNVLSVDQMFNGALSFNQDISGWNVEKVTNFNRFLPFNYSTENYDRLLAAWSELNLQNDVTLSVSDLTYCESSLERQKIIDDFNWDIRDSGQNCPPSDILISANTVYENQINIVTCCFSGNELIGELSVVDEETDSHEFNLKGESNSFFSLLSDGRLYPKVAFDFESRSQYELMVEVIDESGNSFEKIITIEILDDTLDNSNAFVLKWNVSSENERMELPIEDSGEYNYTVLWGDGIADRALETQVSHEYDTAGEYTVKVYGQFPRIRFRGSDSDEKILSVEQWGDIQWTSMEDAFLGCTNLVINASDVPDLSNVTSMQGMFWDCNNLKGDFSKWDVSNVEDMTALFLGSATFNEDISQWDVSKVETMNFMFAGASLFNQNISSWDVSSVTNMNGMFSEDTLFNQDITSWDVSNVTTMRSMFYRAKAFDQNIGLWNIANVGSLGGINPFGGVADRDLFNGYGVFYSPGGALEGSGITEDTYESILKGWAGLTSLQPEVELGALDKTYCGAREERDILINSFAWLIIDAGSSCEEPVLSLNNNNLLFEVYPNPTSDRIQIEAPHGLYTISILDIHGSEIKIVQLEGSIIEIDLSSLSNGLYLVQINGKDHISRQKFLKWNY